MPKTGKLFLYLIYFAIVAVLCGFIITSSKSNSPKVAKVPAVAYSQPHKQGSTAAKPAKPSTPTKPTTPAPTSNKSSSATATPSQTPVAASNPAALVNTGPGDIISLFVFTSIAGTLTYRHLLIKRAS